MTKCLLNLCLYALAGVTSVFTLTLFFAFDSFFHFVEVNLVPDGKIQNREAVVDSIYLLCFALGAILFLLKGAWVHTTHRPSWPGLPFNVKLFYAAISLMLSLSVWLKPVYAFYKEDGILENITVLLAFGSGFMMLYVSSQYKFTVKGLFALALAASVLLFGMEEISWGQRIFGWETTAMMLEINQQQENNLHNLFNDYFAIGYVILTGVVAAVFFFRAPLIRIFNQNRQTKVFVEFMPAANFFYTGYFYIFLMLYTLIWDRGGETLEAILALTCFGYSVDAVKKFESKSGYMQEATSKSRY